MNDNLTDGADNLIVVVEHVKYRKSSGQRSPIGRFTVYTDRIEWLDNSCDEKLCVMYSNIKGQRISPPNKTKVQLQFCLLDGTQETFAFVNPSTNKEAQTADRDLVKEAVQQALINYRQAAQKALKNADYEKCGKTRELETKRNILANNAHLQHMYKHLVASKLISAQDFWSEYYQVGKDDRESEIGISNGFLSSAMLRADGANSLKINLSVDTIRSIFRAYPSVEKKHLELVPHEMSEKQFWSKFFQSHYFHREREYLDPSDPFVDCIQKDDVDMQKIVQGNVMKKNLDFSYINDNLALDSSALARPSSSKSLLIKRFNYHSSRVLMSCREKILDNSSELDQVDTKADGEERVVIDSNDLRPDELRNEGIKLLMKEETKNVEASSANSCTFENSTATKTIARLAERRLTEYDYNGAPNSFASLIDFGALQANGQGQENGYNSSSQVDLAELRAVHLSLVELLKHFWTCFPPTTPKMNEKLDRMEVSIKNFETNILSAAEQRFGQLFGWMYITPFKGYGCERVIGLTFGNAIIATLISCAYHVAGLPHFYFRLSMQALSPFEIFIGDFHRSTLTAKMLITYPVY